MHFIVLLIVLKVALFGAFNPLVKPQAGKRIIDVGYDMGGGTPPPQYAPKIWAMVPGVYVPYEAVNMYARDNSPLAQCIIDNFGREACPLLAETCQDSFIYSSGVAEEVSTYVTTPASCIVGTTYNTLTQRCESGSACNVGYTYDAAVNQCIKSYAATSHTGTGSAIIFTNYLDQASWCYGASGTMLVNHNYGYTSKCNGTYNRAACVKVLNVIIPAWDLAAPKACACPPGQTYAESGRDWHTNWASCTGTTYTCSFGGTLVGSQCVLEEPPLCPAGTSVDVSTGTCNATTFCQTGYTKISASECKQNYSYYHYKCQADVNQYGMGWSGPVDNGTDCLGACPSGRSEGCVCNLPTPPANNCVQQQFLCPLDAKAPCVNRTGNTVTKKPMQIHANMFAGFTPYAYGQYSDLSCGDNCLYGINRIYADDGKLCFSKPLTDGVCSRVGDCTFSGSIEASNNHLISAIWTDTSNNLISASTEMGEILPGQITSTCSLNGAVGYLGRKGPIIAVVPDGERLKFWSQYEGEGYLGFIESIRQVYSIDAQNGYVPENNTPWQIKNDGFNRIETFENATYAVSQHDMSVDDCIQKAAKYGFYYIPPVASMGTTGPSGAYEIVANSTGGNYNSSMTFKVYTASAACPQGFENYDPMSDTCKTTTTVTLNQNTATMCNDHTSNLSYYLNSNNVHIRWTTGTWNCGGSGYFEFSPIAIPSDATVQGVEFKYSSSGGGCESPRTGSGKLTSPAQSLADITFCPSDGAQYPTLNVGVDIIYDQKTTPVCPDGAISRAGLVCTMPLSPEHRCVIAREDGIREDFKASSFSIKKSVEQGQSYICSPLSCSSAHTCQYNECKEGTDSKLVSEGYPAPKSNDCTNDICDSNLPYYQWCGKNAPCPIEQPGFVNGLSGCVHLECKDSEYDSQSGKCYKWKCPDGYTDLGGQCVKN